MIFSRWPDRFGMLVAIGCGLHCAIHGFPAVSQVVDEAKILGDGIVAEIALAGVGTAGEHVAAGHPGHGSGLAAASSHRTGPCGAALCQPLHESGRPGRWTAAGDSAFMEFAAAPSLPALRTESASERLKRLTHRWLRPAFALPSSLAQNGALVTTSKKAGC